MTHRVTIVALLSTLVWSIHTQEANRPQIKVGEFTISLPSKWQPTHAAEPAAVAKRYTQEGGAKVAIGEIMAATLTGSIAEELSPARE
jgi:hypothetical protein